MDLEQLAKETLEILRFNDDNLLEAFKDRLEEVRVKSPRDYSVLESAVEQYAIRLEAVESAIEEGDIVGKVEGKHFYPVPDFKKFNTKRKPLSKRLKAGLSNNLHYADISLYCDEAGKFLSDREKTKNGQAGAYGCGYVLAAGMLSLPLVSIGSLMGYWPESLVAVPVVLGVALAFDFCKSASRGFSSLSEKYGCEKKFRPARKNDLLSSLANCKNVISQKYKRICDL